MKRRELWACELVDLTGCYSNSWRSLGVRLQELIGDVAAGIPAGAHSSPGSRGRLRAKAHRVNQVFIELRLT
jgi:hypothetical protein